jgi:hypothetical protein
MVERLPPAATPAQLEPCPWALCCRSANALACATAVIASEDANVAHSQRSVRCDRPIDCRLSALLTAIWSNDSFHADRHSFE